MFIFVFLYFILKWWIDVCNKLNHFISNPCIKNIYLLWLLVCFQNSCLSKRLYQYQIEEGGGPLPHNFWLITTSKWKNKIKPNQRRSCDSGWLKFKLALIIWWIRLHIWSDRPHNTSSVCSSFESWYLTISWAFPESRPVMTFNSPLE